MALLHADQPSVAPEPPPGLLRASASFPDGVEPRRDEWFLHGTEPGATPPGIAPPLPRIRAPRAGTVLALDPDIPASLQRITFEAEGLAHHEGDGHARWQLDGRDVAAVGAPFLWTLEAGRHQLALLGGDGAALDAVAFEVRGGAPPLNSTSLATVGAPS